MTFSTCALCGRLLRKVTEKGFILAALARELCRELRNGQGYNGAGNSEKKEGPACVRALPFLVENGTVQ